MNHKRKFAQHGGQARNLAVTGLMAYRWLVFLLLAFASIVMLPVESFARVQALTSVLTTGYSPASMNTSNLPQSQILYHDKNFIANLKANTPHLECCDKRELPENSGNQLRLYKYNVMGANTSQQAEGTVGAGTTVSVKYNTATIGNYADYVNISRQAVLTALDDSLSNIQKELGYRLALSVATLIQNVADGAAAIDGSVDDLSLAYNVSFGRSTINSAATSMLGRNIRPMAGGKFKGIIHSFLVGDALNDTSSNSIVDIIKRSAEGQGRLSELPNTETGEVPVLDFAGVEFRQSTIVTQTANYGGQGGTAFRTYIFGQDALIAISLGKKEGAQIGNGDWRNMKLWMYRTSEPSGSDPSAVIGGWTSYNVNFVATLPPDTVMRMRYIDAQAIIS